MSSLEKVKSRFESLNGIRAVDPDFIENLEHELKISLPTSFKLVGEFFDGSGIYVLPLHQIGWESPTNVLSETKRLRNSGQLLPNYLVLGEPAEGLIVMDCNSQLGQVLWCDAIDVNRLGRDALMTAPEVWGSYLDFVEYLLSEEESDRL
ncbi:hypothetical protein [Pseudomonas marginalis]|jgi:hypothetical protein|uniref:hypothetical protein n=1 Tax=Pseudomonas marginalis TaxID=298 RepID=UPI0024815814|nr:hypothetical protein [Pseudomonas marginalis]WGT26678.1 hypothetical protein QGQ83_23845 [Pseudomonas marginalis]